MNELPLKVSQVDLLALHVFDEVLPELGKLFWREFVGQVEGLTAVVVWVTVAWNGKTKMINTPIFLNFLVSLEF